jgi:photosystem II stability/assembly factor-like uncharacterized protein
VAEISHFLFSILRQLGYGSGHERLRSFSYILTSFKLSARLVPQNLTLMKFQQIYFLAALAIAPVTPLCGQSAHPQENYVWKNVVMGGGGNVPGIVLHPKIPDLAYIRTDVGGSYRWDKSGEKWIPLQEEFGPKDWNQYGAESIAVDPSDATGNTVYLLTGKYSYEKPLEQGGVYKSIDRGATWIKTPTPPEIGGSSNTEQSYGERLAVDPNNGNHVLYATKLKGLWRTLDGANSWDKVETAPTGVLPLKDKPETNNTRGLVFAIFDGSSGLTAAKRTKRIYLGASGEGIARSEDGGESWTILHDSPKLPRRAALGKDGSLLVTHEKGVAKYFGGTWNDITPPQAKTAYQAIAVDPRDTNHIITAQGLSKHELPVFRTTDSGKTWKIIDSMRNQTAPWWPSWHWLSSIGSLSFDPHYPNRVWATDWYGVYRTPNISAPKVTWTNYVRGHEEIVTVGALTTIPVGNIKLFTGVADVGGFDHENLDEIPQQNIWAKGFPGGFTNTGIAWQPTNPLFMARVGTKDWRDPGTGGYSLDGGKTWTVFPTLPYKEIRGGRVAIAAEGTRILWAPQQGEPHFTDDYGKTWTKAESGGELKYTVRGTDVFQWHQPLAADGGDKNRFYIFKTGKLWRSDDGGANWKMIKEMENEGTHMISSVPGKAGHLWMSMNFHGLRRSTDGGITWNRVGAFTRVGMFALGKPALGKDYPTIFAEGMRKGERGYFRSDDEAQTWVKIDMPGRGIGNAPNTIAGDWQVFGRVFVGTNGRGIYYGQPASTK